MKKNNIRYSKEKFKKLLRYIDNHRKQFVGSVATVGLTGFITLTSFLSFGCTQEEIDAANELISQLSTEQTVDNPEPEIEVVEPKTVIEPEVVEPVEEVNPRDMKAVYNLDFDVPIYTEEEVEQAKEKLQNNYADYNVKYEKDGEIRYYTEEERAAIKDDYYIANQDFFYQLYSMTNDFDPEKCYADNNIYFYDEEKDWTIKVSNNGIEIRGKDFMFKNTIRKDYFQTPAQLDRGQFITIGPGSYVLITNDVINEPIRTTIITVAEELETDIKTLEEYGYHNEELQYEHVGFEKTEELTLTK